MRLPISALCAALTLAACGDSSSTQLTPDAVGGPPHLADRSDLLGPNSRSTTDVLLADLDKDADLDILWLSQDSTPPGGATVPGAIDVTINEGGNAFRAGDLGFSLPAIDGYYQFARAADFDHDGDLDLILSRAARARVALVLLANDGTGKFTKVDNFPVIMGNNDGLTFSRVALADVDNDGDIDIVVPVLFRIVDPTTTVSMPNVLLLNDGTGTFSRDNEGRLPAIDPAEDFTLSIAAGDVNGDGAPDLFVGNSERQQQILINDGTGRFTDQTLDDGMGVRRIDDLKLRAYRSEMVDIDADGDLDILVVSDTSTSSPVPKETYALFNDGKGHFTTMMLPDVPSSTYGLATGDLNSDKFPDLVIGHSNEGTNSGNTLELLIGAGDGKFSAMPLPGLGPWDVGVYGAAVGDVNGDGVGDVAVAVGAPNSQGSMANILLLSEPQ